MLNLNQFQTLTFLSIPHFNTLKFEKFYLDKFQFNFKQLRQFALKVFSLLFFILNILLCLYICCCLNMDVYDNFQMQIAREYTFNEHHESVKETPAKKSKVIHSKIFLKCREHYDNKPLSIINANCSNCLFFPFVKEFHNGKNSFCIDVLSVILTEGKSNKGKSIEWHNIAVDLVLHWVFCSVYTKLIKAVKV